MGITLQPAIKYIKPMKTLFYGPTYSGKTLSALYLAAGTVMSIRKCTEAEAYKHVILIDTEFGRGALHNKIGPYNYLRFAPPYKTEVLVKLINELNGMPEIDVIIIDSLTHFWVKEGGILDSKAAKDKLGGNSYTNWMEFTALFNKMLDAILESPKHIFVTARSKTDTALVINDQGKSAPRSYGLKPELRDGIDFDFDIVFNVDKLTHNLLVDKGVPGTESVYPIATPELGTKLFELFNTDAVPSGRTDDEIRTSIKTFARDPAMLQFIQLKQNGKKIVDMDHDELINLEVAVVAEAKKNQIK